MTPSPRPNPRTQTKEQHKVQYDGKVGQLYKIMILDILLRIVTIGIYAFWGRTRLRKYLVNRHELGGDRFEYTGTGGELFKGFLKALPFIVVLIIPLALINVHPIFILGYLPILYFVGIAIYGALRYRYNRTRWRGISGFIEGSTIKFANLVFVRTILNIISFGFLIPSTDIKVHSYIMNNAYFGTIKAEYTGNSKILFAAHIKSILLALAIMSIFSALIGGLIIGGASFGQGFEPSQYSQSNELEDPLENFMSNGENMPSFEDSLLAGGFMVGFILTIILLPLILRLTRAIYYAALMREKMRGLQIGNLKFMSTVGAWDVVKHRMLNTIILIVTLGIGYPFIVQRNRKFFVRHLIIMGDIESFHADQAKHERSVSGEGFDAALDLDIGIM